MAGLETNSLKSNQMGEGGNMQLEGSNLVQTKQSHKHGLCKAAGAPRLP